MFPIFVLTALFPVRNFRAANLQAALLASQILLFQHCALWKPHVQEKRIHQIFAVSVSLKGLHALFEVVAGIALYLTSTETIVGWITSWSSREIAEERNDWIASHLMRFAESFSVQQHNFYAFYLLSHGIVKGVLVVGLLKEKLWAYPASFVVFGLFIAYQLYRYSFTHDVGLILLSIFDLFVIYLAVHEYRLLRKHLPTH